jgi:hypothetical protein
MKDTHSRRKNLNIDDIIVKLCEAPFHEKSFALREY